MKEEKEKEKEKKGARDKKDKDEYGDSYMWIFQLFFFIKLSFNIRRLS